MRKCAMRLEIFVPSESLKGRMARILKQTGPSPDMSVAEWYAFSPEVQKVTAALTENELEVRAHGGISC